MRRRFFISAVLFSSLFGAACNRGIASVSSSEHTAQNPAVKHSNRDEIVLPAAEQATAGIQTETVALSEAPDVLRVSGRIALADDRNWHVGVRTEGLVAAVYAGLGDNVKKGQVLARYHADQVHELRAQYRSAMANLNRVQAGAALAQRNCDRLQTLLSLKAASVQQVEQARQDLVSAQAEVQSAQSDVERAHGLLEDDLHVAAEPPAGNHDETADDVPILAPATGYVIEKKVNPGKSVTPSGGDEGKRVDPSRRQLPGQFIPRFARAVALMQQQYTGAGLGRSKVGCLQDGSVSRLQVNHPRRRRLLRLLRLFRLIPPRVRRHQVVRAIVDRRAPPTLRVGSIQT